jgi:LacI family transcriptional regulator
MVSSTYERLDVVEGGTERTSRPGRTAVIGIVLVLLASAGWWLERGDRQRQFDRLMACVSAGEAASAEATARVSIMSNYIRPALRAGQPAQLEAGLYRLVAQAAGTAVPELERAAAGCAGGAERAWQVSLKDARAAYRDRLDAQVAVLRATARDGAQFSCRGCASGPARPWSRPHPTPGGPASPVRPSAADPRPPTAPRTGRNVDNATGGDAVISDPPAEPRRATMADVARVAGVSATTVSFVLNENSGQSISTATRQRVLDAVAALDYRPNRMARGLRTRRTATIGFVTDEIAVEPFAGATILGAHEVAWQHGSMLLVVNTTRDRSIVRDVVDDLVDRSVDGIIFAVVGTRRITVPDALKGVPALLVNGYVSNGLLPSVLPDEVAGGRAATELLLQAGHTRIAYLTGQAGLWPTRARLRGFRQAISAAGLDPDDQIVRRGDYRTGSGYRLTRDLLAACSVGKRPPTAIMCGNDRMAIGVYLALCEAGIRVPQDMSVVGYDDQVDLALSTVRLPYYQMGRWAAEQVITGAVGTLPPRSYLPCPPVPRESVASPGEKGVRPR